MLRTAAAAFVLIVLVTAPVGAEGLRVETEAYSLGLSDDWVETPSSDPEQRLFASRTRDVHLVVSSMKLTIPPERFEQIARFTVARRIELEQAAAASWGEHATFLGPIVVNEDWGASMSYSGAFSGGRQFSYSGSVTRTQVLNLYVESRTLSHEQLMSIFGEVTAELDFSF